MRLSLVVLFTALVTSAHAECVDDLRAALILTGTSGPYKLDTKISGSNFEMTIIGNVVPPAALHTTTTVNGTTQELVVIDGVGHMNVADSGWQALPPAVAAEMTKAVTGMNDEIAQQLTEPKCLGTTAFEGKDYTAYTFRYAADGAFSFTTLYVDPATGRPEQMLTQSKAGDQSVNVTAKFAYDPSLVVTLPEGIASSE